MRLSTSLVAVKKITSNTLRSNFSEEELEQVAKLILQAEGLINPILVQRTGINSFEVVDGDFEYYAAVKAREIDPKLGEMIETFILEEGNENVLQEQVKLLRSSKSTVIDNTGNVDNSRIRRIETQQANLELRIEQRLKELKEASLQEIQLLRDNVKEISSKIFTKEDLVQDIQLLRDDLKETGNKLSKFAETLKTPGINKPGKTSGGRTITESPEVLDAFNNLNKDQLNRKLETIKFSRKTNNVVEAILKTRDENKFISLDDVVNRVKFQSKEKQVKGISLEKMLELVDSWSSLR